MKTLFAKLFGNGARLSALEKLILDSVRSQLDSNLAVLWNKQVAAINKIQRLPEGVEVNFYRMKQRRPSFDDELIFPNKTEELLIAKVRVGLPNVEEKLTASVWCVNGFLFSINYDGSVSYFEEAAGMNPQNELKLSCAMVADLSLTTLNS